MTMEEFYKSIKGKTIAFCGLGGSNVPLAKTFSQKGAIVTGRDRRSYEKLGDTATELEKAGVRLILGDDYLNDLHEEIIFRTPGIRFHLPELETARKNGQIVTSEMEVFFDVCPCPIFGITGSDGKTTTTSILAEILKKSGKTVHVGGNIGTPLLPKVETIKPNDVVVAELSSFQLISMRRSPMVGIVTNITPNHLDMHKDMNEYINAKKNIILHQNAFGRAVLNLDNEISASFAPKVRGQLLYFSRKQKVEHGCWLNKNEQIIFSDGGKDTVILDTKDIRIPGSHNIENYMAAICASFGFVSPDDVTTVAKTFPGVAHRAEFVRELNGVRWYNDSIATTPSRTIKGMLSIFSEKLILIAGGYDKKIPFEPLGQPICDHVKTLVLLGNTAPKIETAVKAAAGYKDGAPKILHVSTLQEAVDLCNKEAHSGDVVALSPACASYDMFPNFVIRGNTFKEMVMAL
ncbi:UDP-N-acetylmuramoyl-L-alanine--D-glutamate ligase [Caproicibacterium sp. BJN0003]|uniref:UDP-N-acetylmuramoyl-L-alanine--D-glutamate ligase n=1 Tax=Caproicibacterium sp. BJN0003 TaxID=2994078 RepID=UPI002256B28B|nr:UDP-N-acetylmuramoyl-L-alanine--D-glutamate ligase [Caproicibacterium sp. BJN0003]UZT81554.1 UDP-N-acetylmuramoyl-L-alanine--D-glutamate ligase [Caproicibacterium sp. BJN0003]